jgi:hypothetical protein
MCPMFAPCQIILARMVVPGSPLAPRILVLRQYASKGIHWLLELSADPE